MSAMVGMGVLYILDRRTGGTGNSQDLDEIQKGGTEWRLPYVSVGWYMSYCIDLTMRNMKREEKLKHRT